MEVALKIIEDILNEGKDITNLLWEMIKYVKDILVYQSSKKLDIYSEEEIKQIELLANKINKERLMKLIYELSEIDSNIKWSTQKTIMFQAGIIKLCCVQTDNSTEGLEKRIEKLEESLKNGIVVKNNSNVSTSNTIQNFNTTMVNNVVRKEEKSPTAKNRNVTTSTNNTKSFSSKVDEYWPQIINDLKQNGKIVLYTNLMNTRAKELNDMTIGIEFPNGLTSFGKTVLEKQENIREISNLVSIACGKEMQIKYLEGKRYDAPLTNEQNIQQLANQSDIPFQVIE